MRLLLIMGLLSFIPGLHKAVANEANPLIVDLKGFAVGKSKLGKSPAPEDLWTKALTKSGVFEDSKMGFELGTKKKVLDYAFFDLEVFRGSFSKGGLKLKIGLDSNEATILEEFGKPYWIDRSDGELILFYVYDSGKIELQFEFSDGQKLSAITISRGGVLSDKSQRDAYGVDKPWPPTEQGEQAVPPKSDRAGG